MSRTIDRLAHEIVEELSNIGYDVACTIMAENSYTGETLASLQIVRNDDLHYTIMANSTALLFFEFGAGVQGTGHPQAGEFGMGAGTYPNQKHALDPRGWWFPTEDPQLIIRTDENGQGWGHSYGNPPHMPFYNAATQMKLDFEQVVEDVFSTW